MEKDIKIRHIKKDIKSLNKTIVAAQHMKQAYMHARKNVKQEQPEEVNSPVEYAESKMKNTGDKVLYGMAHQTGKQIQLKRLSFFQLGGGLNQTIKTVSHTRQTIRTTGENNVKYAGKAVKTAEQTKHVMVKTAQKTEESTHAITKVPVKFAENSVQAVKAAEQSVRVSAKVFASVVRGRVVAAKSIIANLSAGGGIAVLIMIIVVLLGGTLCIVGGGNSASVAPVSAEVEAYTPIIKRFAIQYGVGEYVELIKAVMMQESGGRGLDPMQCSEGSFNTRYPKRPNGITDPEYSISCGVQEIKAALMSAEVESPVDMERIKLALQGYNFGNGYISWAKSHYGGYTMVNAAEFSDMMARRMGWSGYGDRQYVPHVLRYYAFGRIPAGAGDQAIVQIALSQEGNGGDIYWRWYGFGSRVEWCACFVSWCAEQCGYIENGMFPKFSLCSEGVKWFDSRGQFRDGSYVPAAGDIIFFDWGNDGTIDHVGIVENVADGQVNTIEGNSGDRCQRQSYSVGNSYIYGYGILA